LKKYLFILFICCVSISEAQQIDSIYIDLYTDSLKKGTYNYINIDGLLSNGRYLPLDSTHLIFSSPDGIFFGNCLWIDPDYRKEKVSVKVSLRSKASLHKEFDIPVKKKPDDEILTK
jgi:hypothetical protein